MRTKVVQICIRRNIASAPIDVVYAHEVPILKVARGAGAISITDPDFKDAELKAREVRSRDELIRLKRKYASFAKDGQPNPVDVAFPDGSRDLELFYEDPEAFEDAAFEEGGGAIEDEVVDDGAGEEDDAIVDDGAGEEDVPPVMDREEVVAKLTELGVPFANTTPTKHLQALLERSVEEGVE